MVCVFWLHWDKWTRGHHERQRYFCPLPRRSHSRTYIASTFLESDPCSLSSILSYRIISIMDFAYFIAMQGGSPTPAPRRQRHGSLTLIFKDHKFQPAVQTLISKPAADLRSPKVWEMAPCTPIHSDTFILGDLSPGDSLDGEESVIFSPRSASDFASYQFDPRSPVYHSISPAMAHERNISPVSPRDGADSSGPHYQPDSPGSDYFRNRTSTWSNTPQSASDGSESRYYDCSSFSPMEGGEDAGWSYLPTLGPFSSSYAQDSFDCDGCPSSGSDIPREYLESQFDPERRRRSLSPDEVDAMPPFHVVAWLADGREIYFPPEHPDAKNVLDAYLYENSDHLPEGVYVWHDESGRETALTVLRKQPQHTANLDTRLDTAIKQCPLPPHLDDLPYGWVVAQPTDSTGDDEYLLSPENVISTILRSPHQWKVGDLPQGHIYRWRIEDVTWVLNTGPIPASSPAQKYDDYAMVIPQVLEDAFDDYDNDVAERTLVEAEEIHQKLEEEDYAKWD